VAAVFGYHSRAKGFSREVSAREPAVISGVSEVTARAGSGQVSRAPLQGSPLAVGGTERGPAAIARMPLEGGVPLETS
jgi:hypothetical protein